MMSVRLESILCPLPSNTRSSSLPAAAVFFVFLSPTTSPPVAHSVVIVSRNTPKVAGPWRHVIWDGRALGEWREELNESAGLVNLAGRSVNCIKTPDYQDEILRSRVESTRALGQAMRSIDSPTARVGADEHGEHLRGSAEVDLY